MLCNYHFIQCDCVAPYVKDCGIDPTTGEQNVFVYIPQNTKTTKALPTFAPTDTADKILKAMDDWLALPDL